MSEPLDELYFVWLTSQVESRDVLDPSCTHWKLFRQLYSKEFTAVRPNDENRLEDGKDLRYEFLRDEGIINADRDWMHMGCSALELMIGMARRIEFETELDSRIWFWRMLENIGLAGSDDRRPYPKSRINGVLDSVIFRKYSSNGRGGFFPLRNPPKDQRKVELWYQAAAYVQELI